MNTLTQKYLFDVDCCPNNSSPNQDSQRILNAANNAIAEYVSKSTRFLGKETNKKRLLDIGCGVNGSIFVNRASELIPEMDVIYLDSFKQVLDFLKKPHKVRANATNLPFTANTFDCAYAGNVINRGILLNDNLPGLEPNETYKIAEEAMRVLRPGGLFRFTYTTWNNDQQTRENLNRIGFSELEHLLRTRWFGGAPTDTYVTRKPF